MPGSGQVLDELNSCGVLLLEVLSHREAGVRPKAGRCFERARHFCHISFGRLFFRATTHLRAAAVQQPNVHHHRPFASSQIEKGTAAGCKKKDRDCQCELRLRKKCCVT